MTSNWKEFKVKTHLGNMMKCGAYVMGYDMSQINADEIDNIKNIPEIILVKRIYPEKNKKNRIFKLRRLEKDGIIVEEKFKK